MNTNRPATDPKRDYVECVRAARDGDLDAFTRLVGDFQDLAVGTAYGWLGDAEAARDVSQEAFLDAYARLAELRDPAAFPAWLRRIVVKHCDRLTRRRDPLASGGSLEEPVAADEVDVETHLARAERASRLRAAVSTLPAAERLVLALHYFAELTGPELADFLDLPLPTIKKRLRRGRARLREHGESLMSEALNSLRPSRTGAFTAVVTFFLAIRAGDHARVRSMLERSPALVEAIQDWSPELVWDGVLPFASRATALITAVERDDAALLDLLLAAGADPDGACACATGESPVWAATVLDRREPLRRLLARGAAPDRPSSNGNRPLHVAAMRGFAAAAELLLAHGADPEALDARGRTAADWAEINGHRRIAARLRGENSATPVRGQPQDATDAGRGPVLFTGIKAVDLLCPLPRGGLVRVPFMAGVGMAVLLGELCHRVCSSPAGMALWTGFAQRPFDVVDWRTEMSELGIIDRVIHHVACLDAGAAERRAAFQRGLDAADALRDDGRDTLVVLMCDRGFEADVEASLPRLLQGRGPGSLTTMVVTPFPETPEAALAEPLAPFGAQLKLDRRRARKALFPALDPALCWSQAPLEPRHARAAEAARTLLERYAVRYPGFDAFDGGHWADPHLGGNPERADGSPAAGVDGDDERARRLIRYLVQPFYVAEPFTARSGLQVHHDELLADVEDLLRGVWEHSYRSPERAGATPQSPKEVGAGVRHGLE